MERATLKGGPYDGVAYDDVPYNVFPLAPRRIPADAFDAELGGET